MSHMGGHGKYKELGEDGINPLSAIYTYFSYGLIISVGHILDFFSKLFRLNKKSMATEKGFAPLLIDFEDFYKRRLYGRIHDCWNRPINSCPGAWIGVKERNVVKASTIEKLTLSGKTRVCYNLGSYNYLGFGDPDSPTKPEVLAALEEYGSACASPRQAAGTTALHMELEKIVCEYAGQEACIIFGMGYGTNSSGIPSLIGKGGLIISDSKNHTSIVNGARGSGAKVKVFEHNDVKHLEAVIRKSIVEGQPRTHRPWTKILIVVEGIYSMEGEMCPLADIVRLKKKYNCYLYVDEAHSIGAIGPTGRGICEHAGVDPLDVDIMMGTFTKSFGAVGGYICASRAICAALKKTCPSNLYHGGIPPVACKQIIQAMSIIMGTDGTNIGKTKLTALKTNSNYFRQRMMDMGCHVLGDWDSPICPVMLYNPAKIAAFSRECYERNLAVVVVGFPATPLLYSRTRFCISAAHTVPELEVALKRIEEVVDLLGLRYVKENMRPPKIETS